MNTVVSSTDMIGSILSFLKIKHIVVLLNVSKQYRHYIEKYLWKKYKVCIKNLEKKRCIECDTIDFFTLKYKHCEQCSSHCYDCLRVSRRPFYTFPASYEFTGEGLYEIPFYKYCCLECEYKCDECGYKSSISREFYKVENKLWISCYNCKNKEQNRQQNKELYTAPIYWIADTYPRDQHDPFSDYRHDPYFSDDIFLFSFYLEQLFSS